MCQGQDKRLPVRTVKVFKKPVRTASLKLSQMLWTKSDAVALASTDYRICTSIYTLFSSLLLFHPSPRPSRS